MSQFAIIATVLYFFTNLPFAYLSGLAKSVIPLTALAAVLTMTLVWTLAGFWRRVFVDWRVLLCAALNSGIIITTVEAMAYKGGPIFKTVMVLTAGVLGVTYFADRITENVVSWNSAVAGVLAALSVAFMSSNKLNVGSPVVPLGLGLLYLGCIFCYGVKLPLFSKIKRQVQHRRLDFLISHQTFAVLMFGLYALYRYPVPTALAWQPMAIGAFSQLSGVFGSAILLSEEEHSATVPMKTIAKMLAGWIAGSLLGQATTRGQWWGFACLFLAACFLMFRKVGKPILTDQAK